MSQSAPASGLYLEAGRWMLQGLDLEQICREHGTPLYLYDAGSMRQQYAAMIRAFAGMRVRINYAAKANTNLHVLRLFESLGAGLDTVSIFEVQLGLMAGFSPERIVFTPNSVSFDEIREAVKLGVHINIDNISFLEQFGHEYEGRVPLCLRFNPHIAAGGNTNIQVGHMDSKFGISVFQRRHVLRIVKASGIRVEGLHIHTGSDILNAKAFAQVGEIMFDLARDFEDLRFLDFGGGFKVPYKPGDFATELDEVAASLQGQYDIFCQEYGRPVEIWFEPGKYLVSEAGYFLVRTNLLKTTPAMVFAGVDSGLNHLIRPMFYGAYHDIFNVSNPAGTPRIYTIVGNICETDTFGTDRKLAEVREGDVLALRNAGAYGYAMSSNYNMRPRPAEVMVDQGRAQLIRRRETLEDLIATTT